MMNNNTYSIFSRWWWPGQWLRIVWSMWVNQKWYWQNVRPRLRGRKAGWGILVQGMLGSVLVVLPFSIALAATLEGQVGWTSIFLSIVMTMTLCAAVGSFSGTARGLVGGTIIGMTFGVTISLIVFKYTLENWVMGMYMVGPVGVSANIAACLLTGTADNDTVLFLPLAGLVVGLVESSLIAVIVGLLFGLVAYLSGRWATRQIPDAETRKRLANPNTES